MKYKYNHEYIVIWAWPWWLTVGIGLWASGKNVLMIEKWEIWGDCTNHWCVPSKALLHAAKSEKYTTLQQAMEYVRTQRQHVRDEETPEILAQYGVNTTFWLASFVDRHTVKITQDDGVESIVTAKKIIIATGAKARTITIEWADQADLLTNESLFEIDESLNDLVILGGWVIACEMAEAFVRLGTNVTILERHHDVIPREDRDVSALMHDYLVSLWVTIHVETELDHAEIIDAKKVVVTSTGKQIIYDKILLTIGRIPLTKALTLENVWIETARWWIVTNDKSKTSVSNIYAIGDCVASNPNFTHRSNNQWRILVQNLLTAGFLLRHRRNTKQWHPLPWTIFTTQEVSKVWLNQTEAEEQYGDAVVTRTFPFAKNDRSKLEQTTPWMIKLMFKRVSLKLVGVVIVGKNSGELLPQYTIAMKHGIGLLWLMKVIYQYPTRSEIIKLAIDDYILHMTKNWKTEVKRGLKNILNGRVFKAL
jgi:pyruvate/2-oxoglutarate dehydrogenase complex dihydrolipoamide dehydrogenase (E3) component